MLGFARLNPTYIDFLILIPYIIAIEQKISSPNIQNRMTAELSIPEQQVEQRDDTPNYHQRRWKDYFSFSTDHKVIGIQYFVTGFIFYLIGGLLAEAIRTELATPDPDLVDPAFYNSMFTMHGTIMIFLWIVPAGTGAFANYLLPLMIGARDMAFPKLNAVAFWMIPPAGLLLMASFFTGTAQAGWTSYPPLSLIGPKAGEAIWILSLLLLGTSSILGGINFFTTILKMRVPSMTMMQMPHFRTDDSVYSRPGRCVDLALLRLTRRDCLLQPYWWRTACSLPAHVLVLLAPSGLHHGLTLLWGNF
jgi:hypothetical protein